jgi:hypothetical protein
MDRRSCDESHTKRFVSSLQGTNAHAILKGIPTAEQQPGSSIAVPGTASSDGQEAVGKELVWMRKTYWPVLPHSVFLRRFMPPEPTSSGRRPTNS